MTDLKSEYEEMISSIEKLNDKRILGATAAAIKLNMDTVDPKSIPPKTAILTLMLNDIARRFNDIVNASDKLSSKEVFKYHDKVEALSDESLIDEISSRMVDLPDAQIKKTAEMERAFIALSEMGARFKTKCRYEQDRRARDLNS